MGMVKFLLLKEVSLLVAFTSGVTVFAQTQPSAGVSVQSPIKHDENNNYYQLSLRGDRDSIARLIIEDDSSTPVSNRFLEVICAQNGAGSDLFARQLFWSGNAYNQVRSMFWIKNRTPQHVKAVLLGKVIIPKETSMNRHVELCQSILSTEFQTSLIRDDVRTRGFNAAEKALLETHAAAALSGSSSDARALCEYYLKEYKEGLPIVSILGYDWIELCIIEAHGFPGANPFDRYIYWLIISAENGDAESQWRLSKMYDRNEEYSKVRGEFWLTRSVEGAFKPVDAKSR